MKERYSIGEIAGLFGLSVQTLRFYEKMGLVIPEYVNPKTGYRYYSRRQFHYIDRIHHLQGMGLTLKEIRMFLQGGHRNRLQQFLRQNLEQRRQELETLQENISDLQWYIQYFEYMDFEHGNKAPHVRHCEERYLLSVRCNAHEPLAAVEERLRKLRAKPGFNTLHCRKCHGFLLDSDDLLEKQFLPSQAFAYLKGKPGFVSPHLITLPAGDYLCFSAQLHKQTWNASRVLKFFANGTHAPGFAVANQYEETLMEYAETPYEVQIFLQPTET